MLLLLPHTKATWGGAGSTWTVSFMGRLSCSDNSLIYNEITKRTYSKDTDTDRELVQNMS